MRNREQCAVKVFFDWIQEPLEFYLDDYRDVLQPFDFLKLTEPFYNLDAAHDLFAKLWELSNEKRLNRSNAYAAIGKLYFDLNEKELPLFIDMAKRRADILKAARFYAIQPNQVMDFANSQREKYFEVPHLIDIDHDGANLIEDISYLVPDNLTSKIDKIMEEKFKLSGRIKMEIFKSHHLEPILKDECEYEGLTNKIVKEEVFKFNDLSKWDRDLNKAAKKFKNIHGYWPNIMQASTQTYRRIEIVANANPDNIKGTNPDGSLKSPDSFVELAGFQGDGYALEMMLDEKLKELSFRLIFDNGPDGGLEETEELSKAV
jgi:hypothetical protein